MSQTPKLRPQSQSPEHQAGAVDEAWVGDVDESGSDMLAVPEFTRRHLIYLLGFTLAAAIFRLWDLGTWSFWVDEAHTYRDVLMSDRAFWDSGTSRYPLSFMLLRMMKDMFDLGPTDLTEQFMRIPFAFFGIASVPALAIVARGMVGRRAALLASLFLALSPWPLWSKAKTR